MPTELLTPQVAFAAGIMLQACTRIWAHKDGSWTLWKFLALFPIALFFTAQLYFDERKTPMYLPDFLLLFGIIFTVTACVMFRRQLLSKINEIVLMVWNVSLFYLTFTIFGFKPIILIPLSLSLLSFFIAIFHIPFSRRIQISLYIWFMLIGIFISIGLFPWGNFKNFNDFANLGLVHMFFLGMTLFYAFSYIVYLGSFVVFPDKYGSNIESVKKHEEVVVEKFDETQFHPYATSIVLVVLVIIFALDHVFRFAQEGVVLAVIFGISPYLGEKTHKFFHKS